MAGKRFTLLGPAADSPQGPGWKERWHTMDILSYGIEHRHDGMYWVSWGARDNSDYPDIGPFETFEAAAACFETLAGLD